MKPITYKILQRCVEEGVSWGFNRSFKYTETPDQQHLKESITEAVMHEICEYFLLDQE